MSQDDFFAAIGVENPAQAGATHGEPPRRRRRRAQERAIKRRKRRRRIITVLVLVVALAVAATGGYKAWQVVRDAAPSAGVEDFTGAGEGEVIITIPPGASGNQIAQILYDAGVVASKGSFTKAYAANSNSANIQAGTYTLRLGMSAANAVAMLLDPASRSDHVLTVPEGATRTQVKERLMAVGGFTDAEVEEAFADAEGIGLPQAAGGQVEGWLAPSTYDIAEDATATDVVASMVTTSLTRLSAAGVAEADYQAVLIKASIVEREVSTASYYGQVARVIENRLADTDGDTKGYLQMDSTVLYGLGRTGGIPSTSEIADSSNVYNTYAHAGLPPTPIGSPGEVAIQAVLAPPEGDWLYFVTVDLSTGETLFAATLEEQKENTKLLDAYCARHEDVCAGSSSHPTEKS